MEKVCVSVVVPVYNVIHYLDECLRSLINQTLQNIEIILVDDGSTDGSNLVCDAYAKKDERIRVIHKENGGLGSARNEGLKVATGHYVYFIDSDDFLSTKALEELYNKANSDELEVLLFSAECFADEAGIEFNENEYNRSQCLNEVLCGKDLFIKLYRKQEYYASIPLRLYKTSFLQSREYLFPENIIHEDEAYAYWSMIQAERAECIADKYYKRRFRAASIMTSGRSYDSAVGYTYTWCEIIKSMDVLDKWSDTEKELVLDFAYSRLAIAINYYVCMFNSDDRKNYIKEITEIKNVLKNRRNVIAKNKQLKLFIFSPGLFRTYQKLKRLF